MHWESEWPWNLPPVVRLSLLRIKKQPTFVFLPSRCRRKTTVPYMGGISGQRDAITHWRCANKYAGRGGDWCGSLLCVVLLNHFDEKTTPPTARTHICVPCCYARRRKYACCVKHFSVLCSWFSLTTSQHDWKKLQPKCVRVTCFWSLTTCRDAFEWAATAHGFYIRQLIVLTSCSGAWEEQRAEKSSHQH